MKLHYALILTALISLMACAGPVSRPPVDVESFNLISNINLAKPAKKAVYNPSQDDLFVLGSRDQEISIYKGSELKNVLGGLGTGENNFLNLAEIPIKQI